MRNQVYKLFIDHSSSVREPFIDHLSAASRFPMRMIFVGLASRVHELFPSLFIRTGNDLVTQLHSEMITHQAQIAE